MRWAAAFLALLGLPASLACVSVSTATLTGAQLSHPVSLSQSIVDASGNAYKPSEEEKVKHFRRSWTRVQMLWGLISLTRNVNFSRLLDEEIERAEGNGIVNLTVRAEGTGLSWLTSLIFVLPQRVTVVVEGDVIRTPAAALPFDPDPVGASTSGGGR